ncbi:hypothetical protein Tco_0914062 [Tanacetum coccineum]
MNDDTPMCECHEANYIQLEDYKNQNSHDSYSHPSYYDLNDYEKSLIELNNVVRNDLKDFKSCMRSIKIGYHKLFKTNKGKTTCVLTKKNSKTVNKEPQPQTDFEKSIRKFLDGQRVSNMFIMNNINDMILKMKHSEKNFQTKIRIMERKIDEWLKSLNVPLEQTDGTKPPLPQAQTEQMNVVFTGSGKSDDPLKIQKDPPPPIIVSNKIKKDKPIKIKGYHVVKTNEYPFREYVPKVPYPQRLKVDQSHLNRDVKES